MKIADRMGLSHTVIEISVADIDRGKSSENRARDIPLDDTRLEGITHSYMVGIPMPMIFVRVASRSIIIAGGNHRFNGLPRGIEKIKVHAIECTDAEFELLCRALNTTVGVGMSRGERVRAAVDAVRRLGLTRTEARAIYGLSKGEIENAVKKSVVEQRIVNLVPAAKGKLLHSHCVRLGELAHNDNVLKAAAAYVIKSKCGTVEFARVVSLAKVETTEAKQVAIFESASGPYAKGKAVSVPRRIRTKFLTALTNIEIVLEKKSWQALEMEAADIPAVKAKLVRVIDSLNSLCKENG